MATATNQTMSLEDVGMLVLLSIFWGGTFLFAKIAVVEIPPMTLVFLRVAIAAVALATVLPFLKLRLPTDAKTWRSFFVLGFLNNALPFTLLFFGQRSLGAGLESILNATTPLFTVLVLHVATKDERLTALKGLGVVLGFLGVVVLVGPEALGGITTHALAELLCLGATLSYALALLYGRRFRGTPPLVTATGQLVGSTILMAPLSLLVDRPWLLPTPSLQAIGAVVAMALLSTALAYVLYFRIMVRAGATNAALVTFLIPVSAIALGALVLGERLAPLQAAGLGLILLGLVAIDGRLVRRLLPRPARQG